MSPSASTRVHKIAKSDYYFHVRLNTWNNSAPTGRSFMKLFSIFQKSVEKIQVSLKSYKNKGCLKIKTYVHLGYYLAEFFLQREMLRTKVAEKIHHTLYVQ
jgi:hypothetical protein